MESRSGKHDGFAAAALVLSGAPIFPRKGARRSALTSVVKPKGEQGFHTPHK